MKILKTFLTMGLFASISMLVSACNCNSCDAASCPLAQICCSSQKTNVNASNLDNTFWIPTFVMNQDKLECPANATTDFGKVFISFKNTPAGLRVHGMSGVNIFNGMLKFESDGEVDFSKMMSTMRAGKFLAYEQNFLKALDETDVIVMSDDTLNFYEEEDDKNVLIMSFKKTTEEAVK